MTSVRDSQIEEIANRFAEYESEIQSYADENAELRQENESLKAQINQMISDRSMVP